MRPVLRAAAAVLVSLAAAGPSLGVWQTSVGPDYDGVEVMIIINISEAGQAMFLSCRKDRITALGYLEPDDATNVDTIPAENVPIMAIANDQNETIVSEGEFFRADAGRLGILYTNDEDVPAIAASIGRAREAVQLTLTVPNLSFEQVITFDVAGAAEAASGFGAYCSGTP